MKKGWQTQNVSHPESGQSVFQEKKKRKKQAINGTDVGFYATIGENSELSCLKRGPSRQSLKLHAVVALTVALVVLESGSGVASLSKSPPLEPTRVKE